ncbi:MAG TPA: hypothetical protein VGR26_05900 [Acidimicrobiales bacterium]|nr:hypothetical protein [Acidimicrobiales bacterium]
MSSNVAGRIAYDDSIGTYVCCNDCAGTDDGAVGDGDPGEHHRRRPNPYIVSDRNGSVARGQPVFEGARQLDVPAKGKWRDPVEIVFSARQDLGTAGYRIVVTDDHWLKVAGITHDSWTLAVGVWTVSKRGVRSSVL